jgi:hypothetical protein
VARTAQSISINSAYRRHVSARCSFTSSGSNSRLPATSAKILLSCRLEPQGGMAHRGKAPALGSLAARPAAEPRRSGICGLGDGLRRKPDHQQRIPRAVDAREPWSALTGHDFEIVACERAASSKYRVIHSGFHDVAGLRYRVLNFVSSAPSVPTPQIAPGADPFASQRRGAVQPRAVVEYNENTSSRVS